MIDPSPELPDDTPIESVGLPLKVKRALLTAGLKTVGDIRETPDTEILQIQNLGKNSFTLLRETLGLPSSLGVRSDAVLTQAKSED
jgi:DNA-directed RNA polymerase alpha subunit